LIEHIPVLLEEVVRLLEAGETPNFIVDATLGLGGYSERFLREWSSCKVLGIDRDPMALEQANQRLSKEVREGRFVARESNFCQLAEVLDDLGWGRPDAVVFDLGVSNLQISLSERGFSFQEDGPLDMRMGRNGQTASDLLNTLSQDELRRLFRDYGEEPHAGSIAKGIVAYRQHKGPIETTGDLVSVIRGILPAPLQRKMNRHPARRIFQALRIAVNDEIGALPQGLEQAGGTVKQTGCIVAVSYHSLEDRIVKHTFNDWETSGKGRRVPRRAIRPSDDEVERNYKSRSAMLRVFRMADSVVLKGR
jgi:16S rRNA (cytosine1402-N4)-methyltransferase